MPPAVIAPAIGAVASLGGAVLGGRAQSKAQEAQERASGRALAFEEEQAGLDRAERERMLNMWMSGRQALAQHLGISLPGGGGQAAAGAPGGAVPGGAVPRGLPPQAMGGVASQAPAGIPTRPAFGDLDVMPEGQSIASLARRRALMRR